MVKIVVGEVAGEVIIDWRPFFAGGGLNSQPPVKYTFSEFFGVDIVTTRIISVIFHEVRNLSRPVARWERKTSGLRSSECDGYGSGSGRTHQFRVSKPGFLFKEQVNDLRETSVVGNESEEFAGGRFQPLRTVVFIFEEKHRRGCFYEVGSTYAWGNLNLYSREREMDGACWGRWDRGNGGCEAIAPDNTLAGFKTVAGGLRHARRGRRITHLDVGCI